MATKRTAKKTTTTPVAKVPAKKAVKRTSQSRSSAAAKTTPVKTQTPVKVSESSSVTTSKPVRIKKAYIALIVIILLVGALLYFYRGLFVAAVVNGQPISRIDVVRQAEQQSGKQILDTMVRNALIEQKAKQQGVSVNDSEINTEIKKLQDNLSKQGQNIEQVLQAQGMNKDDLRKLIRLDKLVSKMVGKDVKVSDDEVNAYIEKNKETLPQGTDEATLKKQVSDQLKQQKTNEKVRTWLADLQKQAVVKYYVTY